MMVHGVDGCVSVEIVSARKHKNWTQKISARRRERTGSEEKKQIKLD